MRVLWLVGGVYLFPEAVQLLEGKTTEINATGGWITASANMLAESNNMTLAIVMASPNVKAVKELQGEKIQYFVVPTKGAGNWKKVVEVFNPDVVHIHGTENYNVILKFLNECGNSKTVVSIQGVAAPIARFNYSGIPLIERLLNTTLADIKRNRVMFCNNYLNVFNTKSSEIIKQMQHVIGRTSSDCSYVWSINPEIHYHFCNETLREEFYSGIWNYNECNKHTIFLSQASRPLKGLHFLLHALPLVKSQYPDVKVRIGGDKFAVCTSLRDKIKRSGYGKYINKMMNKYGLSDCIEFLGPLNAEEMKEEYLKANVFVNPSTIENSPNSLCEAQILGVPSLSSYVGGVPDMMPNSQCGEMYRFDEPEVLAYKLCRLFETSKTFDNTVMRQVAKERHDAHTNVNMLIKIYEQINKVNK